MIWWNIRHTGQIYYTILKDIGEKIEEKIKNLLWSNKKWDIPGTYLSFPFEIVGKLF